MMSRMVEIKWSEPTHPTDKQQIINMNSVIYEGSWYFILYDVIMIFW